MEYKIAIVQQLPSLLKSMRKKIGLTQKEMGEKLGVSQRRVAAIEAHPESARFERILQILFELDADLIVRERNETPAKNHPDDGESW